MALVIAYEKSWRRLQRAIEIGWDDSDPDEVAFGLPDGTKKGDRVLYFVGGRFQYFFGWGRVLSNERIGKSGLWKGETYWLTSPMRELERPVPGADVAAATGWPTPARKCIVPSDVASTVWRAARGRPLIQVERAMEGATTEARSKYRNPKLRQSALQLANGTCAACGTDFRKFAGDLGRHCLVVHHKKQLKDSEQPRETKVSELAVVCANCHMMIHANPSKALKISQLRRRLTK